MSAETNEPRDPADAARIARITAMVRDEIVAAGGAIPFPRFMELALYAPGDGYYEHSPARVGREGDFYTSVSVGPVFGELLAFQFAEWAEAAGSGRVQWVEAGAHDGKLAADILAWVDARRPEWRDRIDYIIFEPSETRRAWQRERLEPFGDRVSWVERVPDGVRGVIFGNELLDAFPIERFGWDADTRSWYRRGVGINKENAFEWRRLPIPSDAAALLPDLPQALLDVLPEGCTWECSPSAERWWADAGRALASGWLVSIDYGLTEMEFFTPGRTQGTLRGYRNHRHVDDVLADPGGADLTAHVNYTRIEAAGRAVALGAGNLMDQRQFLTRIMGRTLGVTSGFGEWTQAKTRQFQTLTHPQHLGNSFRVLVQGRASPPLSVSC